MILALLIVIAAFSAIAAASVISSSLRTGVVPMPSLRSERKAVVEVLAGYDSITTIADLGSGWGGLARLLERKLDDRRIIAVEQAAVPHFFGRVISRVLGVKIEHRRCSIFDLELAPGNAYVAYLSGPHMKKLRAAFEQHMPQGGVLISIAFAMPGWTPSRSVSAGAPLNTKIYVYDF